MLYRQVPTINILELGTLLLPLKPYWLVPTYKAFLAGTYL